jgi:hypothetical protein
MKIDDMMKDAKLTPDQIHLPAGGVAVFARSGAGKSSMFYGSRFLTRILIADTGSQALKLFAKPHTRVDLIDASSEESPIEQVQAAIVELTKSGGIGLLDSFSTLQEVQVLWFKRVNKVRTTLSIPQHGVIVGQLRDLVLMLAQAQFFTTFNTTAGGQNKTPSGEIVNYPAGALTGYQSLNGTEPNKETILARWGNVWGAFAGFAPKGIPRGLYVPSNDIRPEGHEKYAPLKDPLRVIKDTSEGKGIMACPNLELPENQSRCFADELLVDACSRWPKSGAKVLEPKLAEGTKGKAA